MVDHMQKKNEVHHHLSNKIKPTDKEQQNQAWQIIYRRKMRYSISSGTRSKIIDKEQHLCV